MEEIKMLLEEKVRYKEKKTDELKEKIKEQEKYLDCYRRNKKEYKSSI